MKVDFKNRKVYFGDLPFPGEDFIMEFVFTIPPVHPDTVIRSEDIEYFQSKVYDSLAVPTEWFGE